MSLLTCFSQLGMCDRDILSHTILAIFCSLVFLSSLAFILVKIKLITLGNNWCHIFYSSNIAYSCYPLC